jgi:16S rRNA G966 N2-methylase RsmD
MSTLPVPRTERDALTLLEKGRQLLAQARDVGQVKQLRDQAAAVAHYLRQQKCARHACQDAAELKVRAERRLGTLLAEPGDRRGAKLKSHGGTSTPLPDGVTKQQSQRWRSVADLPEDIFEAEVTAGRRRGDLSTASLVKLAGREVKRRKNEEARQHLAGEERASDLLRVGDFRRVLADLPDGSVDCVFTDPPYQEEHWPLYGDVAALAARVLREGGSLVAYAPTYAVDRLLPLMTPHLTFWSALVVQHAGTWAPLNYYRIRAACKFLLWLVKGRYEGEWLINIIPSTTPDKVAHDWQQSEAEAAYCIEQMTGPGGQVVDPFAGSGTTLLAARKLGRRCLGAEIDPDRARVAAARLAGQESG